LVDPKVDDKRRTRPAFERRDACSHKAPETEYCIIIHNKGIWSQTEPCSRICKIYLSQNNFQTILIFSLSRLLRMVDEHDWHSEATVKTKTTKKNKTNEPKLPVQHVSGTKLADCTIILRRDPKDAGSKVPFKEYDFWGFKRLSYNNDRDSFRTSDLVNDFISKAIEKFKRDSNPRKPNSSDAFTYTDAVRFTTPRFGDTTCVKNSPCDYIAAVEEMIEAGLRRFEFRITTSKTAKETPGSKRKLERQQQQIQPKKQKTGANEAVSRSQTQIDDDPAIDTPVEGCQFTSSPSKWSDKGVAETHKRQTVDQ
jgi:hypothetical protein